MRKMVLMGAALTVALAACAGDDGGDFGSGDPGRPMSTAELKIIEPAFGSTVEGPDVEVVVEITGARVLEKASRDLRSDTGHIHVSVNDRVDTLLAGERYTVQGLEPGEYIIKVEFAAADHGSFSPPVIQTARITVT